ncbi:hypothetical protein [Microbacterium hominis]|uniref:Uncharacterized protein n=1 Tax=Microbacterium hominis TaxID=162426 RepID=A0A7D4TFG2_9MICO|nr:hypothetical protein [Microbacterium hominis]QKJ19400.1 hypothetical protein HQM25_08485 [Microbacterium hominis]
MRSSRAFLSVLLLGATTWAAVACATPGASAPGSSPAADVPRTLGTTDPNPPEGAVIAQGTVLDAGGRIQLCLGAVAESYPPQCAGIPLEGWEWAGLEGAETSGDTRWGAYAVQGDYDGETFTVTGPPIMLALYDPMMAEDPTAGVAGVGDPAILAAAQDEVPDLLGDDFLSSAVADGWLWIDVVWDDGTWQRAADADFGAGAVVVRSALRELP